MRENPVLKAPHSMADPTKPRSGSGCFSKLILLILLAGAMALGSAVYFASQPQDLTDIGGYTPGANAVPVRDMKAVLKNSIDRGYPLTLTEEEINAWLGRTLSLKQDGLLSSKVSLERVWVRLTDGVAEVIMERKILGKTHTVSLFLQINQYESAEGVRTELKLEGGPFHEDFPRPPRGGRFGKLVVPQGFLILIMPAYSKLAALFPTEKELGLEEMARIKIEKGRLVLDPRAPTTDDALMPRTF
jgi:hypothetical protein